MNYKLSKHSLFFSLFLFATAVRAEGFPAGYEDALKLFQKNKYSESLETVRSNFVPSSRSYEFRMLAAANYYNLGNLDLALQHLNNCRAEHPERYEPIIFTSVILRKSGNVYGAAREIIQGIARFPDAPGLRIEMSRIYFVLEKLPESRAQLDVVLQKNPNNIDAILMDGLIFIKQGRYEEAEFRLKNVLGMKGLSLSLLPLVHNNLGLAVERLGLSIQQRGDTAGAKLKYKEALDNYSKALSISPAHPVYLRNKDRISKML